jgi:hypothetical protein
MKRMLKPKNPMTRMALKALQDAVAKVVERHRREGRPLAVWQNGKAVLVSPKKVGVVRESRAAYRTRKKS